MAGFTSAINTFAPIVQGAQLASTIATQLFGVGASAQDQQRAELRAGQDLALKQLQAQQKANLQAAQENAALERERLAAQAQQADEQRRAALKRAVARQRTQFGASGIAGDGGSAEALLLGLFDESDEERARREELDNLRFKAVDQDVAQIQRINTLQRTQLQQRQQLERAYSGSKGSILDRLFSIY